MENYRKTSHSVYDLKYHIVWTTKYRKPVMVGMIAERLREILRLVCANNEVEILAGHVSKDQSSSLVKDGLFLVIRRNCRLSPSMILVVYMIFRISGGYAKNVDRISQLSSQLLTQEGYAGHVRIPHNAEFLIQLSHRCITTLRSSSCF